MIKKKKVVERWEDMKLLLSGDRKEILDLCIDANHSIQDLSQRLNLNPSSVHNHIQKLHAGGFLEIAETRTVNGILEKKYRATAIDFCLSRRFFKTRNQKMNIDIAKAVHKSTLAILESKEFGRVKHHRVRMSEEKLKKLRKMMDEMEEFVLENHGSGELITSIILAEGPLNSGGNHR